MSASARGLDRRDVNLLHRHHRLERPPGFSATNRKRLGQHPWGDLPGDTPAILAPTARAFLAAIADDRVPVAVGLVLRVRCHLEGKCLGRFERRSTVETETRNTQDAELHRQHVALLTARVVAGRLVNSTDVAVGKGSGIEARRVERVLVEPETDGVLRLHGHQLWLPGYVSTRVGVVLLVLEAVVLEHVGVGEQLFDDAEGERPRKGFWTGEGDLQIHVTVVPPVESFLHPQLRAVTGAARVEPAAAVESDRVDDQRVAFPAAD